MSELTEVSLDELKSAMLSIGVDNTKDLSKDKIQEFFDTWELIMPRLFYFNARPLLASKDQQIKDLEELQYKAHECIMYSHEYGKSPEYVYRIYRKLYDSYKEKYIKL